MKKTFFLLTILLVIVVTVSAQETTPNAAALTSKVWKIKNSLMWGVGTHTSVPKETELTFTENGKWKSSQSIDGNTEGTWEISNTILAMTFGSVATSKKYTLVSLNDSELQYKIRQKAAVHTFKWSAK